MPYGLFSQNTTAEYTQWPIRTLNFLLYIRNLRYQKNHARVKVSCRSSDPPPTTSLSTGRLQTLKYWITILLLHNWYTCMTQPHIEKKIIQIFPVLYPHFLLHWNYLLWIFTDWIWALKLSIWMSLPFKCPRLWEIRVLKWCKILFFDCSSTEIHNLLDRFYMQVSFNCYCFNIRAIWLILIFKGSIDCLLNPLSCLQKPVDSYVILSHINLLVIYQSLVSTAPSQEYNKREHSHIAWAKCLPPTSPNSLWLKFNTLSLKFTFNNHTKIHLSAIHQRS